MTQNQLLIKSSSKPGMIQQSNEFMMNELQAKREREDTPYNTQRGDYEDEEKYKLHLIEMQQKSDTFDAEKRSEKPEDMFETNTETQMLNHQNFEKKESVHTQGIQQPNDASIFAHTEVQTQHVQEEKQETPKRESASFKSHVNQSKRQSVQIDSETLAKEATFRSQMGAENDEAKSVFNVQAPEGFEYDEEHRKQLLLQQEQQERLQQQLLLQQEQQQQAGPQTKEIVEFFMRDGKQYKRIRTVLIQPRIDSQQVHVSGDLLGGVNQALQAQGVQNFDGTKINVEEGSPLAGEIQKLEDEMERVSKASSKFNESNSPKIEQDYSSYVDPSQKSTPKSNNLQIETENLTHLPAPTQIDQVSNSGNTHIPPSQIGEYQSIQSESHVITPSQIGQYANQNTLAPSQCDSGKTSRRSHLTAEEEAILSKKVKSSLQRSQKSEISQKRSSISRTNQFNTPAQIDSSRSIRDPNYHTPINEEPTIGQSNLDGLFGHPSPQQAAGGLFGGQNNTITTTVTTTTNTGGAFFGNGAQSGGGMFAKKTTDGGFFEKKPDNDIFQKTTTKSEEEDFFTTTTTKTVTQTTNTQQGPTTTSFFQNPNNQIEEEEQGDETPRNNYKSEYSQQEMMEAHGVSETPSKQQPLNAVDRISQVYAKASLDLKDSKILQMQNLKAYADANIDEKSTEKRLSNRNRMFSAQDRDVRHDDDSSINQALSYPNLARPPNRFNAEEGQEGYRTARTQDEAIQSEMTQKIDVSPRY